MKLLFFALLTGVGLCSCFYKSDPMMLAPSSSLDEMLSKYVDTKGNVNYKAWKNDQNQLRMLIDEMGRQVPEAGMDKREEMAYWINLYNASTVLLILENYPLKSIMTLDGGKVWDRKWIEVDGKKLSLNNIENDILRPKFGDARIHFAVNCAARSCPPLLNRAWKGFNLESTLEERTRAFINNSSYNTLTPNKVKISKIFDWYKSDFGNIVEFLNKYSSEDINKGAKVTFYDYDWNLNGR